MFLHAVYNFSPQYLVHRICFFFGYAFSFFTFLPFSMIYIFFWEVNSTGLQAYFVAEASPSSPKATSKKHNLPRTPAGGRKPLLNQKKKLQKNWGPWSR